MKFMLIKKIAFAGIRESLLCKYCCPPLTNAKLVCDLLAKPVVPRDFFESTIDYVNTSQTCFETEFVLLKSSELKNNARRT